MENHLSHIEKLATRAIKISFLACALALVICVITLWIMLNEITATAQMAQKQIILEKKVESLQQQIKK